MNAPNKVMGPELANIPSNPIPSGARAGFFKTRDNVKLRYALWPRLGNKNKGTICLVQGRTEYIEKYFETIYDFQQRGFSVATFDWRGQGGSDRLITNPKLGHVEDFNDYVADLVSFHADILLPDCPPPFYLVGHSMGGLASLFAATRDRLMFERVFLSAPMVSLDLGVSISTGKNLVQLLKFFGAGHVPMQPWKFPRPSAKTFPGNELTSDHGRYMRMVKTLDHRPDLLIAAPTVGWTAASLVAMEKAGAPEFGQKVKLPVLMLAAANDRVVSTSAIEHLGMSMRTGRHAVLPNARHEIFMENDGLRAQAFAAFDAFITEQGRT
ncbi:lysophospholipase [Maritalea myrionectae]|uniref:Lysophospholipase n=1 Tax=Maritalea myrionectae TaxID=454601 RepID=A0A2R4MB68_9HYPH|nr:alpha/beta hydrolase [Maritalea myrionectae]AVX03252.1 lysophospholipase [Maritalea myrionectae]